MNDRNRQRAKTSSEGKEQLHSSVALAPDLGEGASPEPQTDGKTSADGSLGARITNSATKLSRVVLPSQFERKSSGSVAKAQSGPSSAPAPACQGETATYHGQHSHGFSPGIEFSQRRHLRTAGEGSYSDFMGTQANHAALEKIASPMALQPELGLPAQTEPQITRHSRLHFAIEKQEARDGLQVSDLLSIPGELDDIDENDQGHRVFASPVEEAALRAALFGVNGKKTAANWDSLLDFLPDFLEGDRNAELQQHYGDVDQRQASALWMDAWSEVLMKYTDEVWGDLGNIVREAQREVDEAREHGQEQVRGMKALQRLRQILAHVREGDRLEID